MKHHFYFLLLWFIFSSVVCDREGKPQYVTSPINEKSNLIAYDKCIYEDKYKEV